jgi:arginine exporter protein ArgO
LFRDTITFKKYISVVFFITLGAIASEIEQLWTERTFDYIDIIASIIAAIISIVLYKKLFSNRIE